MGEIAEDIIEGSICQYCLLPFMDAEGPGFPRTCTDCAEPEDDPHLVYPHA